MIYQCESFLRNIIPYVKKFYIMTVVAINQPGYLPWSGFFKRIMASDVFVFLDDVQYLKKDWQNRNKIRTSHEWIWLSVPIKKNNLEKLNLVEIDYSENWNKIHKKSIKYNYVKAEFFDNYWPFFDKLFDKKFKYLVELNMEIINFVLEELEINTTTYRSSEFNYSGKKSDLNLSICKKFNATEYLSGELGIDYLKTDDFKNNNIKVKFADFQHPTYQQCFEPFIPNMAIIDLLFNHGSKAKKIISNSKI